MSDNLIERGVAKLVAIAMVKATYDDCAEFCEDLSRNADAGMPALDAHSRKLAEILMKHVADAFRAKGRECEREFSSLSGGVSLQ